MAKGSPSSASPSPSPLTGDGPSLLEIHTSRAREGDEHSFRAVVEMTHATLYRLALHLTGDGADAEDVVQESFIRAWQRLEDLQNPGATMAWLCQITRNAAKDRLRWRKRKRETSVDPLLPLPFNNPQHGHQPNGVLCGVQGPLDPHHALEAAQLRTGIQKAIAKLPERYRVVLLLREIEGLSYEDISVAMDIPTGTVESRLHRARKAVAKMLKREWSRHPHHHSDEEETP